MIDSEDLKELKRKIEDGRFRINYIWVGEICLFIMFLNQIMKYLDYLPSLFYGADFIFHMLQLIVDISSQLSVSFLAAILFYYAAEFINEKKKIREFLEIQDIIRMMFTTHENIIDNIESFRVFKEDKTRELPVFFDKSDVHIFFKCLKDSSYKEIRFELYEYFKNYDDIKNRVNISVTIQLLEYSFEKLSEYQNFSCYKNFKEDILLLHKKYKFLLDDCEEFENGELEYVSSFSENYFEVFKLSTLIYIRLELYIESIENKRFIQFMKMLG